MLNNVESQKPVGTVRPSLIDPAIDHRVPQRYLLYRPFNFLHKRDSKRSTHPSSYICMIMVTVKAEAASVEDTTGGRSSRTCPSHVALEVLPGLFAASGCKFSGRGGSSLTPVKLKYFQA